MEEAFRATGPHGQRMNILSKKLSGNDIMDRIRNHEDNILGKLIEKIKRQSMEPDRHMYPQDVINTKLESLDRLHAISPKLAPILTALETQNNTLRSQLALLSSELSKSLSICQSLIEENKQQKEIILGKNADIRKIVQSIALNEAQAKGELQLKIHMLQQQNSILIKHLEQSRKDKSQQDEQYFKIEDELNYSRDSLNKVQQNLKQALEREQQLSRKYALLQQNCISQSHVLSTIKDQQQQLKIEYNDLKNQNELLREQVQTSRRQSIRDKYEDQIRKLIQDHEDLKAQRRELVTESQKRKLQCEQLTSKNVEMEQQLTKLGTNYELVSSLLTEQKERNAQYASTINKLDGKVSQLKHQNDTLRFQAERSATVFLQKQKMLQSEIEQLRIQIDQRAAIVQKRIIEIKKRADEALQAKDQEISDLMEANNSLKQIIQRHRHV